MSHHPIAPEDELISMATAALRAAAADVREAPDTGLVFRPEWYPTPRPRISTVAPLVTRPEGNRFHSWALIVKELKELPAFQQEQPNHPTALPIKATYTPEFPSVPPPSVGSLQMPEPLPSSSRPHLQEDAVAELLRRNRKVFNEVINHSFPQAFGNGTASLDGFRYYMIQDKMYLQTCARLKMKAVSEGSDKDVEEFGVRHKSSLKQIERLKATCVTMLSVPESIIEATLRSVELDTTEQFYKTALRGEDALLAYYVILLPCVLIYWTIAERLMEDPSTVRNVVYHSAWTLENYDRSSVDKYKKFINENIAAHGGVNRWNWLFNIACQQELQIFDTGLKAPTPFHTIPDGTYSIHISSVKNLVLAVRNVTDFLRPPFEALLGRYFPNDATSSVVGTEETGDDDERWNVSATKDGYVFKNIGTGLYLGLSNAPDQGEYRVLQGVSNPYHWWINSGLNQGSSVYQIYDSLNLRYTLHAAVEILNSTAAKDFGFTPITAHNNLEAPHQMWSFNEDKFKHAGHAPVVRASAIPRVEENNVLSKNSNRETNLLIAARDGQTNLVKVLLAQNVNIEVCSADGATSLCLASSNGHTDVVKALLAQNANIEACLKDGRTSLYIASQEGHLNVAKVLLRNKANVEACRGDGATSLFIASHNGHTDLVKVLLAQNANIEGCLKDGRTSLFTASQKGHTDIVKVLLAEDVKIEASVVVDGSTSLLIASRNGYTDIVNVLLAENANIEASVENGATSLVVASAEGHLDVVKILLANNANIEACMKDGATSLCLASSNGHTNIVKALLAQNANIEACLNDGATSLFIASENGHLNVVKALLDNRANTEACMGDGVTSLFIASEKGHTDIVKALLAQNANIEACLKDGATSLFIASENGHLNVVEALLDNRANVEACMGDGATSLFIASKKGHTDIVKVLLAQNANIDAHMTNSKRETSLFIASKNGHSEIIKILSDKKAETKRGATRQILNTLKFKR